MYVDCHTHILYGIDDGPSKKSTSLNMIKTSAKQGVSQIWLTPHFDAKTTKFHEYITVRNVLFNNLVQQNTEDVELLCGCEVKLNYPLFEIDNLTNLCINKSNYMLVEYDTLYSFQEFIKMLNMLINNYNIIPIVAHIDRYNFLFKSNEQVDLLRSIGCILQMNTSALLKSGTIFTALKRIKQGQVSLLGTDTHNETTREPNYKKAVNVIQRYIGKKYVSDITENSLKISENISSNKVFKYSI